MMAQKQIIFENAKNPLKNELININFAMAIEDVKNTDATVQQVKDLTVNIMDVASLTDNNDLMVKIIRKVNDWRSDKTYEWKNLLVNYGRLHQDIATIFVGKNMFGNEFVLVIDSVVTQEVLEHNDFCFDLCDDYADIDNFVVLDIEEFSCMEDEYSNYRKVYQRGV